MEKIVLIDGNSILNRAFYGIPDLTNSQGLHTNAIYGFLNIMMKILDEEKPKYLCVAFDVKHPTFRHEMYAEYKGTRKSMPDELREQVPVIKEVLASMNIKVMERPGYEADDILGTMAKECEGKGMEVALISGDKDLLQIASKHTKIRIPKTKKTGTEIEDYNEQDVVDKYGILPHQIIDLKGLMGDASDNIPGVFGIGEKTAIKILLEFESVENAIDHVEQVKPNKAREAIMAHIEDALMSKKLATIKTDCILEYTIDDLKFENMINENSAAFMKRLEFKALMTRFMGASSLKNTVEDAIKVITDLNECENLFQELLKLGGSGYGADRPVVGICFCFHENMPFGGVGICHGEQKLYFLKEEGFLTKDYLCEKVMDLFKNEVLLSMQDVKSHLDCISKKKDFEYIENLIRNDQVFDTTIAGYLINPMSDTYHYDDLAKDFADVLLPSEADLIKKADKKQPDLDLTNEWIKVACFNAYTAYKVYSKMILLMEEKGMKTLFEEVEMPLVFTLYDMQRFGIRVNKEELKEYGDKLSKRIDELEILIHDMAGEDFNINSPKQLGVILFEKMNMPFGKKTKTGYSTSADILEKLRSEHEIVSLILEYRQLTKLKSTYADGLAVYIEEDGRIRSNFRQTIAATGRISSTEPNLQNIPIRMQLGREIRKVFIPKDGYVFVDADYSQIELRVLAHMSNDKRLIEAYQMDEDIHKITASQVFHTPLEEVTKRQRSNAKAVNFGIVYGISSFGLGQDLNITRKEAEGYIKSYFETYPQVKEFLDQLVSDAKEQGVSKTLFHRIRPIPELSSSNFMQRSFGERVAMNSPIQGTAADIIKIAMIRVHKRLREGGFLSKLLLQIHDELLIEAYPDEKETIKQILKEEMFQAASLQVPLEVDVNEGKSWYDVK